MPSMRVSSRRMMRAPDGWPSMKKTPLNSDQYKSGVPLKDYDQLFAVSSEAGNRGRSDADHLPTLGCVGIDCLLQDLRIEFAAEEFVLLRHHFVLLHRIPLSVRVKTRHRDPPFFAASYRRK